MLIENEMNKNFKKKERKENYGCGIFVDFQKACDTFDHNILQNYGVKGVYNKWFASCFSNRKKLLQLSFHKVV